MTSSWSSLNQKYKRLFRRGINKKWSDYPLSELSEVKLKNLNIDIKNSCLVKRAIDDVMLEWEKLGFRWKPNFWYSTEWFYPEGARGIAIPFYLAHPKLMSLEKYIVGNIEGGSKEDIKKYLRHELGHLLDYAYRWRFNKERQKIFGISSKKYPKIYYVKPKSKKYVQNLPAYYAQSHPDEDLAETFAIYMKKASGWRKKYPSGTVRKKLEIVDHLVKNTKKARPSNIETFCPGDIKKMPISVRSYYQRKAYSMGIPQNEVHLKLGGYINRQESLRDLREVIKDSIAPLAIPESYKKFLLNKYYSPLLNNKKVIALWKKRDLRSLKKFVKEKPVLWLKKGPFFYT